MPKFLIHKQFYKAACFIANNFLATFTDPKMTTKDSVLEAARQLSSAIKLNRNLGDYKIRLLNQKVIQMF